MNNEKEYIEIFESNRSLIEGPCAPLLNEKRAVAYERFKAVGFPRNNSEEYRRSNVDKLFSSNYGMNLGRLDIASGANDKFMCDVPNLRTRQEFIMNDCYHGGGDEKRELPPGVLIGSLNDYLKSHPGIFESYYNSLAQNGDGVVQFNTAFVQDGLLVYIPRGVELTETLQVVTLLRSGVELLSNRRLLVILEDNARADILVCDHSSNNRHSLSTQVTEVFLGKGAALNLFELEDTDGLNSRLAHLFVHQSADSSFNHCAVTLTNGFTRNATNVILAGEGARTNLSGLAISDKRQHIDNHTVVEHRVGRCDSSELYKYILDDEAVGVFSGKMLICPDAQHTNSQQTNRNLCLTKDARMYAQPQLEIYADDVKCSHGSTVGQLDENALFYMQQRGIPKSEARHLLMFAFAAEVIDNITIDALRDRLHMLVEKRFRGELNRCKGCTLCK